MKKKMLSLLLAMVMIVGLIPSAFAASGFSDVHDDDWFVNFVEYAVDHNLMSGVGNGRFDPNAPMTRAMAVTVLYSMDGKPAPSSDNPFVDVPGGEWYANACMWAAEHGITGGVSPDRFGPNQLVTREQLVTFLYKYAKMKGLEMTLALDLMRFPDAPTLSDWAVTPVMWAVHNSIISGNENGRLVPQSSATRAECATILMRFDQLISGEVDPAPAPTLPTDPIETEPTLPIPDPTEPAPTEPEATEPEMDIEALNAPEHLEAIAQAALEHINIMRKEEGNQPLEMLPGMKEVAMYRAVQLTTNFAHDNADIDAAHTKYQYGEYNKYDDCWRSHASESIQAGYFGTPDPNTNWENLGFKDHIDAAGFSIANNFHNSEGHWHSIGSARKVVSGIGIHFGDDGELYCCVMVGNEECRQYG